MASPQAPPPLTPEQIASIPDDRGPAVIAVTSLFIGLCSVAVALRFFARYNRRVGFGLDDWLSFVSLLFIVLYGVTCILSVPLGMGRHSWAADPTKVWKILRLGLFNALIYFTVHFFIKLSILAFYKRVFTLRIVWFRNAVYFVFAYSTAWWISSFFGGLFQCFPPAYFWDQYNPALANKPPIGTCGAKNAPLVIATSALNTLGDVLIFSLPIAMLSRLQLNRANQISLFAVFATGAFAIAAGIVRLTRSLSAIRLGADTTWITADIYMWTAVEAGVGLICACLPILGPLFGIAGRKVTQRITGHSSRSRNSHGGTNKSSGKPSKWDHPSSGSKRSEVHGDSESAAELELEAQTPHRNIRRTDVFTVETCRADDSDHSQSFDAYIEAEARTKPASQL